MLPAAQRMRSSVEFSEVLRHGRRATRPTMTVYLLAGADQSRVGLVVSKAVGGSVTRHRVARRLRHLLAERLPVLPVGSRVVVRAAPAAGAATSDRLGADLEVALSTLARPQLVRR